MRKRETVEEAPPPKKAAKQARGGERLHTHLPRWVCYRGRPARPGARR